MDTKKMKKSELRTMYSMPDDVEQTNEKFKTLFNLSQETRYIINGKCYCDGHPTEFLLTDNTLYLYINKGYMFKHTISVYCIDKIGSISSNYILIKLTSGIEYTFYRITTHDLLYELYRLVYGIY